MRGKNKKPVTPPPHLSDVNQQIFIVIFTYGLCLSLPNDPRFWGVIKFEDYYLLTFEFIGAAGRRSVPCNKGLCQHLTT